MTNNLKRVREVRRMRQKTLAEIAQVSQPFIHDLENGNRSARIETWERIAKALGCSVEDLLRDDETQQQ